MPPPAPLLPLLPPPRPPVGPAAKTEAERPRAVAARICTLPPTTLAAMPVGGSVEVTTAVAETRTPGLGTAAAALLVLTCRPPSRPWTSASSEAIGGRPASASAGVPALLGATARQLLLAAAILAIAPGEASGGRRLPGLSPGDAKCGLPNCAMGEVGLPPARLVRSAASAALSPIARAHFSHSELPPAAKK